MTFKEIQNEVIKKYRIDICDGTRCKNDWQRTHAHPKQRRVCKWKQASSIQSTFTLLHEIGHIETHKSWMRRAEQEYHATVWAIEECKKYGLEIPQKIIDDYQRYIDDERDRGIRRGGTGYAELKLNTPLTKSPKCDIIRTNTQRGGNQMKLTHKIAKCRKDIGITQQQLADKLGWTLRKLTSYERDERIPPLTEALELAQALGCSVEDIWKLEK